MILTGTTLERDAMFIPSQPDQLKPFPRGEKSE
jgi:hypothetical protein